MQTIIISSNWQKRKQIMIQESQFELLLERRRQELRAERMMVPEEEEEGHLLSPEMQLIYIPYTHRTEMHMHLLMHYLALMQTQLPNMPKHHLISVLFSPSHESILLLHERKLLAGLSFCQLQGKRVFELSLMASSQPKKGSGTYLINHLKCLAQMRGIKVIATHADNGAIGFYEKMGFSLTEFIENRHLGEQQFSDSTIMQTRINQQIDYFHLRQTLKHQKTYFSQEFKKLRSYELLRSNSRCEYPIRGEYFKVNPDQLPGIDHFWSEYRTLINSKEQNIYRDFTAYIDRLIAIALPQLVQMDSAIQELDFLEFSRPIELSSIRQKAVAGKYDTRAEFWSDLDLLIANCRKLYHPNPKLMSNIDSLELEIHKLKSTQ